MSAVEFITELGVVMPPDNADLRKINLVRSRFDRRHPVNYGVYDTMRGLPYPLIGGERFMLLKIARVWIPEGKLNDLKQVNPNGLIAEYLLSDEELIRAAKLPHVGYFYVKGRIIR